MAPAPDCTADSIRSNAPGIQLRRADAGGSRLRIRALHAMGHCSARIARAAGTSEQIIQKLARGSTATVSVDLRDAVVVVYDAWWDKRPPETTQAEKAAAVAARRRAARGNWCAGAGLDDDLLDQPGYRPDSGWKPAQGTGIAGPDFPVPGIKRDQVNGGPMHTARSSSRFCRDIPVALPNVPTELTRMGGLYRVPRSAVAGRTGDGGKA